MKYPSVKFAKVKDQQVFFTTIQGRVNQYFEKNNLKKTGNWKMYTKAIILLLIYFVPYSLIYVYPTFGFTLGMYLLMSIGVSGIGLAVMHDACHGTFSNSKVINKLASFSMELIGGSRFTWNIQHNIMHHTYTNIYELDEDVADRPFLKFSPHGKKEGHHRFQHIYGLFLYTMGTVIWVINKDFKQILRYDKNGVMKKSGGNTKVEILRLTAYKLMYWGYMVFLPIIFGAPIVAVLLGFLLMLMLSGFFITVVFQLAHLVEGPEHFVPDSSGTMENSWAIHQLRTTANFANNNKMLTWFTGGLNHQIEHHLFPHICHIHYDKISTIVKSTAKEFGLPYHEYQSVRWALSSHLKVLKEFGSHSIAH